MGDARDLESRPLDRVIVTERLAKRRRRPRRTTKNACSQTVSHEWRTPLTAITGLTSLIVDGIAGPVNDQQREFLRRTHSAADYLLALINETLERSRPEAPPEDAHYQTFDLSRFVSETVAMIEPAARAARLELRLRLTRTPIVVRTDPVKVRQIVLNLLSNAVKYTDRGCITVTLAALGEDATRALDSADATTRITVRDSGRGIAPADIPRVFERFWRGDSTHVGAGIGLAVARELAGFLGGELTCASELGTGSTFTLRLPSSHPR